MKPDYDLCIIGGGINGVGIAREAIGRGLSVLLVEAQDLAQATSSSSTKLVHGGLRYLEHGELRLVRESLKERETLLRIAPHIVTPMEFILPHVEGLRPRWMIRLGLFLYDNLAGRRKLSSSAAVSFRDSLLGEPLIKSYTDGYRYSDCWADDARLVVLNAVDAKSRGAEILTRTVCLNVRKEEDSSHWHVRLKDLQTGGDEFEISAAVIINAAGPWVRGVLEASNLTSEATPKLRLVKGSHIIVPRLYEGDHAYILQQPDKRIIFVIPYEGVYSLIGTTDVAFDGDAATPVIDDTEKKYLCGAVNRFFESAISVSDIVWTYSGVRSLFDDGKDANQKVTRDYRLDLDLSHGAPILSVFGGKLTTYRMLAKQAVDKITKNRKNSGWTKKAFLPGGDIPENFYPDIAKQYAFIPEDVLARYARLYGTRIHVLMDGVQNIRAMGRDFGNGLFEAEIKYLIAHEFAVSAEDVLYRRTKMGLHLDKKAILAVEASIHLYMEEFRKSA